MKRQDVFKSTFLSQTDVARPLVFTIAKVAMEVIGSGAEREEKAVVHFSGDQEKPMVLNNFNWTVCEDLFGQESDFWIGKQIEVYVDPNVSFGGKRTGGLRLRSPNKFAIVDSPAAPAPNSWSLEICVKECERAGITREEMIDALKAAGSAGFSSLRDTPIVQQLIAAKNSQEIPF